jgi:hypothetical protein
LSFGLTNLRRKRDAEEKEYVKTHGTEDRGLSEAARALKVMSEQPEGVYERFR